MSYVSYEQVTVGAGTLTIDDMHIPDNCTHAEIQADTQDVRYTMDGATAPTQSTGMVFQPEDQPRLFLIEDVRNMRFTRGAGSDAKLNIHYIRGGRNI